MIWYFNELVFFCLIIVGDGEEGLTAYVEPFVILLILVLNAIVAIWQDRNADSALEALKDMQAAECIVLRDGEWSTIDAKTIVPGDIVQVKQGHRHKGLLPQYIWMCKRIAQLDAQHT